MKRVIQAGYKHYNANSRENYVGDCVKRTLTIAYGLDYDQVSKELNKIKRDLGHDAYNISPVYNTFIARHGFIKKGSRSAFNLPNSITVAEICDIFTEGTYIVTCGPKPGYTNHIVAILNGDFWDSWDCSDNYVGTIYYIDESTDLNLSDVTVDDIGEDLMQHVRTCLEKSQKKMPYATFDYSEQDRSDKYTFQQTVVCKLDKNQIGLGHADYYRPSYTYTVKINPRLSKEENIRSLKEKLWYKIREWAYSVRKEVEDDIAISKLTTNPYFHGDTELLVKLPEWCRQLITYARDNGSSEHYDRYELDMEALPNDPRIDENPGVMFYADTITELRQNLEDYRKHFYRFGYDY